MPPQVADWPEVQATAIRLGSLKEAAKLHQISHASVKMRASREEWPVGHRVHKQARVAKQASITQTIRAAQGGVTSVTLAKDAAEIALLEGAKETKLGLTRYAARMAKQAAEQGNLEEAPLYKAVADIHGKMHPEVASDHSLHLSFFQLSADREEAGPVIDVPTE